MQNVIGNPILIQSILRCCDMETIITLTQFSKKYAKDLFYTICDYSWKPQCKTYGKHIDLCWYDMYCALSSEIRMRKQHFRLRRNYIKVTNCCKCRKYCRNCLNPVTNTDDCFITCPNCQEEYCLEDADKSYNQQETFRTQKRLSSLCIECEKVLTYQVDNS